MRPTTLCDIATGTLAFLCVGILVGVVSFHNQFVGQGQCLAAYLAPLDLGNVGVNRSNYTSLLDEDGKFMLIIRFESVPP
jgi:hypothetical protein